MTDKKWLIYSCPFRLKILRLESTICEPSGSSLVFLMLPVQNFLKSESVQTLDEQNILVREVVV